MPAQCKKDYRKRLDCLEEMGDWGMCATNCTHCGIHNSEIAGALIQCAKCKLAHYCSMKCFNADLQNHAQFCNTGELPRAPTVSDSKDLVEETPKKKIEDSPLKGCSDSLKLMQPSFRSSRKVEESHGTLSTTAETDDEDSLSSKSDGGCTTSDDDDCSSKSSENSSCTASDEDDDASLDLDAEEAKDNFETEEQQMLILEVQEVEEDEDEVHPLYLYIDAEEVQEAETVIWLMREDDEEFSVIRTDMDEEVELIRSAKGTAPIILEDLEEEDEDEDEEGDHYLQMNLPKAQRPASERFEQEAVCLYQTDMDDHSGRFGKRPSWTHRSPLRSLGDTPRRQSMIEPPSWVSSRSLRKVDSAQCSPKKTSNASVPEWISTRPKQTAADMWKNGDIDGESRVRLYRRVEPGESHPGQGAAPLGNSVPKDVRENSVLFYRLPLKPVGTKPRNLGSSPSSHTSKLEDAAGASASSLGSHGSSSNGSFSCGAFGESPRFSTKGACGNNSQSSLLSSSSHGRKTSLRQQRPPLQRDDEHDNSSRRPSWAMNQLRSTGRRESLLSGSDDNSMRRRASSVNVHVPWKQSTRGRTPSKLSFSSIAA